MSSLLELQRAFRRALLDGDEAAVATLVSDDRLGPATRLAVYRNNVLSSLTDLLKGVFPATCRLVDARFFDYAADAFVRSSPPAAPCLSEYGSAFPAFLAAFPACQGHPYLGDVARLEWLMHAAAHAPDGPPATPASLAAIPAAAAAALTFRLQPSIGLIESPWPIDRLWRANRCDAADGPPVALDSGGARLEVRRVADDVTMRVLAPPTFKFRKALQRGDSLGAAYESAAAVDAAVDLAAELGALFAEGAVLRVPDRLGTGAA